MPNAYVTGFDGVSYDYFNPDLNVLTVEHVAKSLARKHRYNGFLDIPLDDTYSVAQHSCYVADRCMVIAKAKYPSIDENTLCRYGMVGLAHDTPEFILMDVVTPFKRQLPDYQYFESIWEPAMYEFAGVPNPSADMMEIMKQADHEVLLMEMKQFGRSHRDMTDDVVPIFEAYPQEGHPWLPSYASEQFQGIWTLFSLALAQGEPLAKAV